MTPVTWGTGSRRPEIMVKITATPLWKALWINLWISYVDNSNGLGEKLDEPLLCDNSASTVGWRNFATTCLHRARSQGQRQPPLRYSPFVVGTFGPIGRCRVGRISKRGCRTLMTTRAGEGSAGSPQGPRQRRRYQHVAISSPRCGLEFRSGDGDGHGSHKDSRPALRLSRLLMVQASDGAVRGAGATGWLASQKNTWQSGGSPTSGRSVFSCPAAGIGSFAPGALHPRSACCPGST